MTMSLRPDSDNYLEDLSALVQHELQNPLNNVQGVIRLLSTGKFGKLSQEGNYLLHKAVLNLERLARLASAVGEKPTSLEPIASPEQMRVFQLRHDLPRAIEHQEIYLAYQPINCIVTNAIVGFEALARWHHPIYGIVSPTIFIPLAEESGLIHHMGKYLIAKACQQLQHWQQRYLKQPSLTVSVNLSVLQLSQLDLVEHIEQVLTTTQVAPQSLKLEITESALIENNEAATIVLQQLRTLGIQLYLDDFGTGYSALSRLLSLPLDALKVDRTFVVNKNWEICEIILALANKLELDVIVEGIETREEADILEKIGFQKMQGYFFSHPLSGDAMSSLLQKT